MAGKDKISNVGADGRFVATPMPAVTKHGVKPIRQTGKRGHNQVWLCECSCGKQFEALAANIKRDNTTSCGCKRKAWLSDNNFRTHGLYHVPVRALWRNMLQRCHDPKNPAFANYGGRGIVVCERWHSLTNFVADMGERRPEGRTLERMNNDGPYSPDNCVWATRKEQSRNTRRNHLVTINGQTKTITEWSELSGIPASRMYARKNKLGWPDERLLDT